MSGGKSIGWAALTDVTEQRFLLSYSAKVVLQVVAVCAVVGSVGPGKEHRRRSVNGAASTDPTEQSFPIPILPAGNSMGPEPAQIRVSQTSPTRKDEALINKATGRIKYEEMREVPSIPVGLIVHVEVGENLAGDIGGLVLVIEHTGAADDQGADQTRVDVELGHDVRMVRPQSAGRVCDAGARALGNAPLVRELVAGRNR